MMRRGHTPTRVRRRQSDAKWRASVAMCYNIMKRVIPNQKKMGRRKVSKALTLKETEKHIVNLEKKLQELIEERAPMTGKVAMMERGDKTVYPATFEDIKKDFAFKQRSFFASNSGNGKKRYNIPADIEASLENLGRQSCRLVVVNRAQVAPAAPPAVLPAFLQAENKFDLEDQSELHHSFLQNLLTSADCLFGEDCGQDTPVRQRTPSKATQTYSAIPTHQSHTPYQPTSKRELTPCKPSAKSDNLLHTPHSQSQASTTGAGFTPVKLPSDPECTDILLSFPTTPAKSVFGSCFSDISLPQTPSSCFNGIGCFEFTDEETPSSNLLCTESIDFEDLSTEWSPEMEKRSPALLFKNTIKDEPRSVLHEHRSPTRSELSCRRKLEEQYNTAEETDHLVPGSGTDMSSQELEGYMLLYEVDSGLLDSSPLKVEDPDATLPYMLDDVTGYHGNNKLSIPGIGASLESGLEDSNSLSADLLDLDIKPFHRFQLDTDFSSSTESYHEVPSFDLSDGVLEKDTFSSDLVPEQDYFTEHYSGYGSQRSQGHVTDSDQVVPEMTAC